MAKMEINEVIYENEYEHVVEIIMSGIKSKSLFGDLSEYEHESKSEVDSMLKILSIMLISETNFGFKKTKY